MQHEKRVTKRKSAFNESINQDAFIVRIEAIGSRLIEANVILRGRFRGIGMSRPGTGKTGHAARHATNTAEFRSHPIDKSHYLGIILIFENICRICRDLLEGLGYFRIL